MSKPRYLVQVELKVFLKFFCSILLSPKVSEIFGVRISARVIYDNLPFACINLCTLAGGDFSADKASEAVCGVPIISGLSLVRSTRQLSARQLLIMARER